MRKILEKCPSCGGELAVTRLACQQCETVVLARYTPCAFCRLTPEQLGFVLAFVKNRGNLKEMERELGESYWALRARLNEVIAELGFEAQPAPDQEAASTDRREILARLERGEIAAAEAATALKALQGANARRLR
jgi:hypothetical protein